jgi:hypothetical protein
MARDIALEPKYSTREIPGRCIKCLAEDQYRDCLRGLLIGENRSKEIQETYDALVSFLESPELQQLRDESERYLAEGRNVTVVLRLDEGGPSYQVKVDE